MKVKNLLLIFMMLIMAGCNKQLIIFNKTIEIRKPPSFSFKHPNDITPEYLQRIKKYDTILKSSPIPVFIIDINDLPEKLKESIKPAGKIYGLYVNNHKDKSWPNSFIFINKNESTETIMTSFFHEYQHHQCVITNCRCMSSNNFPKDEQFIFAILKEKHAIENELRESLKLKDVYLVKNSILSVYTYILYSKKCIYKMASIMIADGELMKKVTEFLSKIQKEKKEKVRYILL